MKAQTKIRLIGSVFIIFAIIGMIYDADEIVIWGNIIIANMWYSKLYDPLEIKKDK